MAERDIVGGMFGITPEMYQRSIAARDTATNAQIAGLTPGQLSGFYAMEAGTGLGRATQGLLGSGGGGGAGNNAASTYGGDGSEGLIIIRYTIGEDTIPPASVSNTGNSTTTASSINFTWTNPADADFNLTMVYKLGAFFHNVTNASSSDNWTGLTESTEYTIGTRTVDITGNVNSTWINWSATTNSRAEKDQPSNSRLRYSTAIPNDAVGAAKRYGSWFAITAINHTSVSSTARYRSANIRYGSWRIRRS
jgi:hypothetical protein